MKNFYLAILIVAFASLAAAQNTADPTLKPHHTAAIKPVYKGVPAHKTPGVAPHKAANIAAPNAGAKANGTDAQLNAIERQQATVHNPKPAPKAPAPLAKANNGGGNQSMNFTYKAPPPNNVMVGGTANGRAKQR